MCISIKIIYYKKTIFSFRNNSIYFKKNINSKIKIVS